MATLKHSLISVSKVHIVVFSRADAYVVESFTPRNGEYCNDDKESTHESERSSYRSLKGCENRPWFQPSGKDNGIASLYRYRYVLIFLGEQLRHIPQCMQIDGARVLQYRIEAVIDGSVNRHSILCCILEV